MIYLGVVTRLAEHGGVYVQVPRVGGSAEFGPCPAGVGVYRPGGRVLVSLLEGRRDDLVVLSPLAE